MRRVRGLLRSVPTAAWLCALVACINGVSWSIITPPFQSPDEPDHVAYVKQLAETGHRPHSDGNYAGEETVALEDLHWQTLALQPEHHTIASRSEQRKLERDLARVAQLPRHGSESGGVAASEPPLYYALESVPYLLGSSGTLLDRLELMRLLSALMGGITALFAFLFVREVLPRFSWAWTVGGLGVALVPLLGFMSGVVNPDSMLIAVTAASFYCLARGFRRGLKRADAVALGALTAIGLMTKLNFVGIAPGVLLGLAVLSVRAARTLGRVAYVSLAIGTAIALIPVAVYLIGHIVSGSPTFALGSAATADKHGSLWSEVSYVWQLYLPRLPGMHADFAGLSSTRQIWLKGYVGLYGWLDTTFPHWVYVLALVAAALIACLCIRGIVVTFASLRARALELSVYGLIAIGLIVLIGVNSYSLFPATNAEYGQARYLLPLIPLLGLVLALAARGAGRRWGPTVGALLVMLFLAHDIFSQLQEIARFYG